MKHIVHYLTVILTLFFCHSALASEAGNFINEVTNKVTGWFGVKQSEIEKSNSKNNLTSTPEKTEIKFSESAFAENFMEERRIYLIDLTRSMEGYNGSENIFSEVKSQLCSTISELTDTTTEVIFIPFTDQPSEPYIAKLNQKDEIIKYINNMKPQRGDTNILGAWNLGIKYLDNAKINYMFMLTDGVHNCGAPIEDLYKALNDWHNIAEGKYEFAFYVLLSPKANEKEICRIVDSSQQMWLVPTLNIKTDFIVGKMNLAVNIRNNSRVSLHLACTNPKIFNEGFKFKVSIPDNDFYKITKASEVIDSDGRIWFTIEKLKPQMDLPLSYKTVLQVDYDKEKFPFVFFTPENYKLNIANVGTRSMTIKKMKK